MPTKKKLSEKVDKRLRAKITVGTGIDGKPIIKYASGRSKKELEANKEELQRHYVGGVEVQRDILFGPYAQAWYKAYKYPKLSESSRAHYESIFRKHIDPVFANRQLKAITPTDLQIFINTKANMCVSAQGYIYGILVNVFRNALAHGLIDRDPALGLQKPGAQKKKRRALTEQEVGAALKVGQEHPEGLLLLILYYTGMRLGEVIGLQWHDVDFTNRMINVRRDIDYCTNNIDTLKSTSSERAIPMPDELYAALNAVRGVGNTFVLQASETHGHLPQSTLKRRWERLMIAMYNADQSIERAVIRMRKGKVLPDGKREEDTPIYGSALTAHYFRHNYASILYNADVDILSAQKFLGHADVKTTLSIYSHLSKDKEDSNAEKVRNALSNSKVAKKLPEQNKVSCITKNQNPLA